MDAVREMKEWLLNKFQLMTTHESHSVTDPKRMMPITPQNIPEFVIPGSNESSRRTSECSGDAELSFITKRNSYSGRCATPPDSPIRLSPSESTPCMFKIKGNGLCTSAPGTPKHESMVFSRAKSASLVGTNNDDPLSFAAMSLPHFRMQTSYGFTTLSEAPHTRRKESLFHVGNEGLLPRRHLLQVQNSLHDHSAPDIILLASNSTPSNGKRPSTSMPSVVITSIQSSRSRTPSPDQSSAESLPNCLSHRRLSPTYQAFHGLNKIPVPRHNRFYNRRRSSLVNITDSDSDLSTQSGQSTPSQNSIDLSNEPQRLSLGDLNVPKSPSSQFKRHSAPQIATDVTITTKEEPPKQRSSSCFVMSKNKMPDHNHIFAPYGELKFSFQYLAASRVLKLTLIKAENLGGQSKPDRNVNAYVKVYLLPGKIQKQTSTVVKHSKNPIFNQDIFFQNISLEELHSMTLKIKIFSKGNNLKLQEFIGEVTIPLDGYDVLIENRIWKDLESRKDREELGYLGMGLMLNTDEGILTVWIDQARSLPPHPLTGPPDPYVRVEVCQPSKSVSKKQTSAQKKTSNPVYDATFTFNVSVKPNDLDETAITIAVFDHDRIRSDYAIGHVVIGCSATESEQYGHWQDVMDRAGNMVVKWHYLVEIDE